MTEDNKPNRVKAMGKAVDVLDVVQDHPGLTLTEITDELGLSKSTVYLHLNTLDELGLVTRRKGGYYLGLRLLGYGIQARATNRLNEHAQAKVSDLAGETGELVGCFVEENGYCVYMCAEKGKNAINTDLYVGKRTYLHCAAGGKAILAFYDESHVDEIIERRGLPAMTEESITDVDELHKELTSIRDRGVAISEEESILGMIAVASPIIIDDEPIGSIAISLPIHRSTKKERDDLISLVKGAANEIQLNLEYSETVL